MHGQKAIAQVQSRVLRILKGDECTLNHYSMPYATAETDRDIPEHPYCMNQIAPQNCDWGWYRAGSGYTYSSSSRARPESSRRGITTSRASTSTSYESYLLRPTESRSPTARRSSSWSRGIGRDTWRTTSNSSPPSRTSATTRRPSCSSPARENSSTSSASTTCATRTPSMPDITPMAAMATRVTTTLYSEWRPTYVKSGSHCEIAVFVGTEAKWYPLTDTPADGFDSYFGDSFRALAEQGEWHGFGLHTTLGALVPSFYGTNRAPLRFGFQARPPRPLLRIESGEAAMVGPVNGTVRMRSVRPHVRWVLTCDDGTQVQGSIPTPRRPPSPSPRTPSVRWISTTTTTWPSTPPSRSSACGSTCAAPARSTPARRATRMAQSCRHRRSGGRHPRLPCRPRGPRT